MERSKRVIDGRSEEGWHRNNTSLACSLDAQRVKRRRCLHMVNRDSRDLGCGWNKIVHKGCAQRLTFLVVDEPFEKRATDALSHATANLSLDHHRIDQPPTVMHGSIFDERNLSCARINFDDRSVDATGKAGVRRTVKAVSLQSRAAAFLRK